MKRFLSFSALVALAWSGFQLYNAYDPLHYMILRPLHVFLALALCFFVYPLSKDPEDRVRRGIDLVLSLISLGLAAYFLWDFERITTRTAFVDDYNRRRPTRQSLRLGGTLDGVAGAGL